jgi:hypothetical protein
MSYARSSLTLGFLVLATLAAAPPDAHSAPRRNPPPNIVGIWNGVAHSDTGSPDTPLRLVVRSQKGRKYRGTLDAGEDKNIPVTGSVTPTGRFSSKAQVPGARAAFSGQLNAEATHAEGRWSLKKGRRKGTGDFFLDREL